LRRRIAETVNSAKTKPWDAAGLAALLFLCGLAAFVFDIGSPAKI